MTRLVRDNAIPKTIRRESLNPKAQGLLWLLSSRRLNVGIALPDASRTRHLTPYLTLDA